MSTDEANDQPSKSQTASQSPPPGARAVPPSTFVDSLPSLRLSVPARGRFSPEVSERCFTYCTQTARGRAFDQEPKCHTFCIRKVFKHEVQRTLADDINYNPMTTPPPPDTTSTPLNIPLPPEAHVSVRDFIAGPSKPSSHMVKQDEDSSPLAASSILPSTRAMRQSVKKGSSDVKGADGSTAAEEPRYWEEGYYLWLSHSRRAATEHMVLMSKDLSKQAQYLKGKEKANEIWAKAAAKNQNLVWYFSDSPDAGYGNGMFPLKGHPEEPKEGERKLRPRPRKGPPFPEMMTSEALQLSISHPPPALHVPTILSNYLSPTPKLLNRVKESVTSGEQQRLAERMVESFEDGAPVRLMKNVCVKMWNRFSGGGEKGDGGAGREGI